MAIITCPQCNNKISDKAKVCPHCGASSDMDEVERERILSRKKTEAMKSFNTQSMLALVLFLGGVYIMYFETPAADSIQNRLAQIACGVGFIWYVINRIRQFLLKNKAKKR